ncbi:quinolinate synthase NadA [Rhizomicrobium electricum]|uniref:Quinolinate synthase n=1 Tax=Rhizomicrobium electricum TaxID=480070 RepID=A0ABP3P4I8_9PROT|nr:quinolinate synthase NadA [Rhizomicrobium electricum]NIJ47304.1 quinolinate synthase [Rhizomicrobium electricum]
MPELPFTPDVAAATEALRQKVSHVIPDIEWAVHAPTIAAINALKREKNAVILAHNYMTPEIFHCVADFVGDSLQLARLAAKTEAKLIVQAGVHFMAETSKVLSPDKTVLIPDPEAGCSLASSITAADVVALKAKHPGLPVVTYVNTSAAVKAESDVCCTSSNARAVVEDIAREWGVDTVIMIPDEFLAQNVAKQTAVKIITWKGHCEVHERFTAADIRDFRSANPGVVVMAHPECPPEVVAESDFAGSTSGMIDFVAAKHPNKVVLVTECSMSDNVAVEFPETEFVRPCNLCPHMKRITLPKILNALETMTVEVTVDPAIAARARKSVERMLAVPVTKARFAA